MIKKKLNFLIILSLILFVFFSLLLGLNKNNYYSTEKIMNSKLENFQGVDLYSNKNINFSEVSRSENFTLINIWASWCLPCKKEHAFLLDLNKNYNLVMIGINYKDNIENAKSFILNLGNPYDFIIKDYKGFIAIELGAYGVPETYLIRNSNNEILKKYIGPIDEKKLKEIKSIIKK